jgi:IS4 transposase
LGALKKEALGTTQLPSRESTFTCLQVSGMTKEEIVKNLVEQVVAMGFKIRLITLDAGFYTVDVLNFISQFNYIVAVPVGDVKVFEEFDGGLHD